MDFWLARAYTWHLYHLQADRRYDPGDRHWRASVGHATSIDLTGWTPRGTVLSLGRPGDWDDLAIWTSSLLRHRNGRVAHGLHRHTRETGAVVERIGRSGSAG